MAEAIARHLIENGDFDVQTGEIFVASAGVGALNGVPTSPETVEALDRLGIRFEGGRSKSLTPEMIANADLVLAMTNSHAEAARRLVGDCPDESAKIATLDPDGDIADPIGMPQHVYDELAAQLQQLIPRRLEELLQK